MNDLFFSFTISSHSGWLRRSLATLDGHLRHGTAAIGYDYRHTFLSEGFCVP
jgi:hypothetical protein